MGTPTGRQTQAQGNHQGSVVFPTCPNPVLAAYDPGGSLT